MYNSGAEISETGRVTLREHQDRKVLSVAQKLMANTTTMPMPMHAGLSLYILKQTGSKELVRVLNKFGHAISYDDAQRYISTHAHQVDLQTIENWCVYTIRNCARKMLPYIVAAKQTNYMSCLPLYLKEMRDLEEKHPTVYNNFIRGLINVHRTEGRFKGVWTDMVLDQTYNKEGKTSLVKGISQNPGAREKYIKSAPFLSHVSESVKAMAQLENKRTSSHHHGASCSQAREEQTLVETIRKVVTEKMVNPFTTTNYQLQ